MMMTHKIPSEGTCGAEEAVSSAGDDAETWNYGGAQLTRVEEENGSGDQPIEKSGSERVENMWNLAVKVTGVLKRRESKWNGWGSEVKWVAAMAIMANNFYNNLIIREGMKGEMDRAA